MIAEALLQTVAARAASTNFASSSSSVPLGRSAASK
jgi:hypothetical protein